MQPNIYNTDVLIIGAGPSGLAAGSGCAKIGLSYVILDAGKSLESRERATPKDIVTGIGGAGLFSDGKFSFFPSASALWQLDDKAALREAYRWYQSVLSPYLRNTPAFPDSLNVETENFKIGVKLKRYTSEFISFENRKQLIKSLVYNLSGMILQETEISQVEFDLGIFQARCHNISTSEMYEINAKAVILACGRFVHRALERMSPKPQTIFRRYEVGVRVDQPEDNFFLNNIELVDPKLLIDIDSPNASMRTFCVCRSGEVTDTDFFGIRSKSGRSDCPPSGRSNTGFNIRFETDRLQGPLYTEVRNIVDGFLPPFKISLGDFLSRKTVCLGALLDQFIRKGLGSVADTLDPDTVIAGPTIEGVGYYPLIDGALKAPSMPLWVAGDATGTFRGLTAAFVSGYYIPHQIAKTFSNVTMREIPVKISSTESLPTIFTAQSKAFYYCRDAVCEYVMRDGKLPLNPFRVFGYFLSDRVERGIVRRSNNRLITLSDEVWVFGPIADGVLFEIVYARRLRKTVRFFNIASRAEEIHPISNEDIVFEPEVHAKQVKKADLLQAIEAGTLPAEYADDPQMRLLI